MSAGHYQCDFEDHSGTPAPPLPYGSLCKQFCATTQSCHEVLVSNHRLKSIILGITGIREAEFPKLPSKIYNFSSYFEYIGIVIVTEC